MAQRRYRQPVMRRALRRFGLAGAAPAVLLLLALAAGAAAVGAVRQAEGAGLVIDRAAQVGVPAEADAAGGGASTGRQEATDAGAASNGTPDKGEVPPRFVVHVDGAVAAPGVVQVEGADARVLDAVELAGGLLDDADTSGINLAEPLVDGSKIHVPHEGDAEVALPDGLPAGQTATSGATGTGPASALVNLNTATVEQLQTLSGVGEVTARAIVEDRERNGPFASPEDLMRVSGIGERKFERVREQICV